ncbi:hypothetical protein SAMN02927900_05414 [Rhizobium mongolense subsp. loessense]|uniref:Uncharacterized protein n=1 Tax=Rhizobium mongolense subsp. loessense TaxID=158890 RepID=A0A1G4TNQ9_9HYPH|nr:hypothetical protein [Rhizobium mongolense]SCW82961.1 hypothetical protein SAMN02927900_05414 [Rhizobium mongolense subsp. loessense]
MEEHVGNRRDEPLTSEDLTVCNNVLDELCAQMDITDDETVTHLASIIIELYRQGVHEPEQLKLLAGATRDGPDP